MAIRTSLEMVTNHWCQPVIGLTIQPSRFYELLTEAIQKHKLPGVEFSRVWWKEGTFLSAEREYLRMVRNRLVYDFCAAPYASGCFFSSWLCIAPFTISAWHLAGMFLACSLLSWYKPLGYFFFFCLLFNGALWWMYFRTLVTTSIVSDLLLGFTGLGPFLRMRAESKPTYYQLDTAGIFQTAIHEAVMGVVDGLCQEQNVRPLDELERKPVAREFLKK